MHLPCLMNVSLWVLWLNYYTMSDYRAHMSASLGAFASQKLAQALKTIFNERYLELLEMTEKLDSMQLWQTYSIIWNFVNTLNMHWVDSGWNEIIHGAGLRHPLLQNNLSFHHAITNLSCYLTIRYYFWLFRGDWAGDYSTLRALSCTFLSVSAGCDAACGFSMPWNDRQASTTGPYHRCSNLVTCCA